MLGVALLSQVAVSLVIQGVPTLSPFLQADFLLSRAEVGLFVAALTIGTVLSLTAVGWAVDAYGEGVVLVWGNAIVGLAALATAASPQAALALACLVLVGVGGAAPTPAGSRAILLAFPPTTRGVAMGLRQTGIPLGGALAALTLPALATVAGWRPAVAAAGVGCLAAGLACWLAYRPPRRAGGTPRPTSPRRSAPAAAWRDMLTRDLVLLGLAGSVLPLGQWCTITYLALYLAESRGVPVAASASLLVGAQLSGAAGRVVSGWAGDRLWGGRRRPPLLLSTLAASLGVAALGWLPLDAPLWLVGSVVVVGAFGAIGYQGNFVALVSELAPPGLQGRTLGTIMTATYLGISTGPPLFGLVVDQFGSWPLAWTGLALVLGLGGLLVWLARER